MSSSASWPASHGDVRCVGPVLMIVSEPRAMSEFSSDMEADLKDKLRQLQPLLAPVSPVSTVSSLRWAELPLSYPALAVSVISTMATLAVTSMRSSGTMDTSRHMPAYPDRTCPCLDKFRMCRDTSQ